MRRTAFFLTLLLGLSFTACAPDKSSSASFALDTRWLAEILIEAQPEGETPPLHAVTVEDEYFREYITEYYGLGASPISGGAIFYAGGMLATEFAVLQMSDAEAASAARDTLDAYIQGRADAFVGYAPFESAMAEESYAVSEGVYVAMFICGDPSASEDAFLKCFTDDPPETKGTVVLAEENTVEPEPTGEETPEPPLEPEDSPEPTAAAKPEDSSESTASAEPTESSEPTTSAEPADSSEPTTAAEPVGSSEPEPSTEPTTSPKFVPVPDGESTNFGSDTPAASESPATAEQPTASEPPAPTPVPTEEIPDVYDKDAVLTAYKTGDTSLLSPKNLAVLEKCEEVFTGHITAGMSDYDKELAVHDWIVENVQYDPAEHDQGNNLEPDPDNDNPYGAMVNGKAICYGYTYSFQLMMELLGFEVISIEGDSPSGPHAWNKIFIDNEWQNVDVTWDDSSDSLQYFNKNDAYFMATGHYLV